MKTVKVIANPKSGLIFTKNENLGKDGKEYGYITLQETSPRINMDGGVARVTSARTCLKAFLVSDWEKVQNFFAAGSIHNGQVIISESTEKKGNAEPARAGKDGDILTHGGQPIYRYAEFTSDTNATDQLLSRDKVLAVAPSVASESAAALS